MNTSTNVTTFIRLSIVVEFKLNGILIFVGKLIKHLHEFSLIAMITLQYIFVVLTGDTDLDITIIFLDLQI